MNREENQIAGGENKKKLTKLDKRIYYERGKYHVRLH